MSAHPSRSTRAKMAAKAVKLTSCAIVAVAAIAFVPTVSADTQPGTCGETANYCTDASGYVTVTYYAGDTGDCIWDVTIEFGDNTTGHYVYSSAPIMVSHTYPQPGFYTVKSTGTNGHSPSGDWSCPNTFLQGTVEYPVPITTPTEPQLTFTSQSQPKETKGKEPGKPTHYKVEVKAWIPFKHVVDPVNPLRKHLGTFLPAVAGAGPFSCYPPLLARPATIVKSLFRGDTHDDYEGSYRVRYWIGFVWDGKKISEFREGGGYGASHRDAYFSWPWGSKHCIQEKTGHGGLVAQKVGNHGFSIRVSAKLPLIYPQRLAPPIDQTVDGTFTDSGSLQISYRDDLFPSHGLKVIRAGVTQLTAITVDSSCLSHGQVNGVTGAVHLLKWLGHDNRKGQFVIGPTLRGRSISHDNPNC